MKDLLIAGNAFAPAPIVEINETVFNNFLKNLYSGKKKPTQVWRAISGANKPNYNYKKSDYKQQMNIIFKQWLELSDDDYSEIVYAVQRLKENLCHEDKEADLFTGSEEERKKAFADTKIYLEKILYLIRGFPLDKRRQVINGLAIKVRVACGGGLLTILADTVYALQSQETFPFWLANLRKDILHVLAEKQIARNKITALSSMHTHIAFLKLAEKKRWEVPLSAELADFRDQHVVKLSDQEEEELVLEFENEFSRERIIQEVSNKFYGLLEQYKTLDLTDADRLCAFTKVVAPFEKQGVFDLNILEENDAGQTVIKEEFWEKLPGYCETLLEREGVLVDQATVSELRKSRKELIERALASEDKALLKAAIPSIELLAETLVLLPESLANKMLEKMKDQLCSYFLDDIHQLAAVLYELPVSRSQMLLTHLEIASEAEQGNENFIIQWKLKRLLSERLKKKLVRDNHPLKDFFRDDSVDLRVEAFVGDKILSPLEEERARLLQKYGAEHERVLVLNRVLNRVNELIDRAPLADEKEAEVLGRSIQSVLYWDLAFNDKLGKYQSWGEQLGLLLLNVLLTLPLFVPAAIKYAATGSWFFSRQGKTQETVDEMFEKTNDWLINKSYSAPAA